MVKLKSFSSFKKRKKKAGKLKGTSMITGGITALIGVALIAETASALRKI